MSEESSPSSTFAEPVSTSATFLAESASVDSDEGGLVVDSEPMEAEEEALGSLGSLASSQQRIPSLSSVPRRLRDHRRGRIFRPVIAPSLYIPSPVQRQNGPFLQTRYHSASYLSHHLNATRQLPDVTLSVGGESEGNDGMFAMWPPTPFVGDAEGVKGMGLMGEWVREWSEEERRQEDEEVGEDEEAEVYDDAAAIDSSVDPIHPPNDDDDDEEEEEEGLQREESHSDDDDDDDELHSINHDKEKNDLLSSCLSQHCCTIHLTGTTHPLPQPFFYCSQCHLLPDFRPDTNTGGFCLSCREICHKDHDGVFEASDSGETDQICNCPLMGKGMSSNGPSIRMANEVLGWDECCLIREKRLSGMVDDDDDDDEEEEEEEEGELDEREDFFIRNAEALKNVFERCLDFDRSSSILNQSSDDFRRSRRRILPRQGVRRRRRRPQLDAVKIPNLQPSERAVPSCFHAVNVPVTPAEGNSSLDLLSLLPEFIVEDTLPFVMSHASRLCQPGLEPARVADDVLVESIEGKELLIETVKREIERAKRRLEEAARSWIEQIEENSKRIEIHLKTSDQFAEKRSIEASKYQNVVIKQETPFTPLVYAADVFEVIFSYLTFDLDLHNVMASCWLFHSLVQDRVKINLEVRSSALRNFPIPALTNSLKHVRFLRLLSPTLACYVSGFDLVREFGESGCDHCEENQFFHAGFQASVDRISLQRFVEIFESRSSQLEGLKLRHILPKSTHSTAQSEFGNPFADVPDEEEEGEEDEMSLHFRFSSALSHCVNLRKLDIANMKIPPSVACCSQLEWLRAKPSSALALVPITLTNLHLSEIGPIKDVYGQPRTSWTEFDAEVDPVQMSSNLGHLTRLINLKTLSIPSSLKNVIDYSSASMVNPTEGHVVLSQSLVRFFLTQPTSLFIRRPRMASVVNPTLEDHVAKSSSSITNLETLRMCFGCRELSLPLLFFSNLTRIKRLAVHITATNIRQFIPANVGRADAWLPFLEDEEDFEEGLDVSNTSIDFLGLYFYPCQASAITRFRRLFEVKIDRILSVGIICVDEAPEILTRLLSFLQLHQPCKSIRLLFNFIPAGAIGITDDALVDSLAEFIENDRYVTSLEIANSHGGFRSPMMAHAPGMQTQFVPPRDETIERFFAALSSNPVIENVLLKPVFEESRDAFEAVLVNTNQTLEPFVLKLDLLDRMYVVETRMVREGQFVRAHPSLLQLLHPDGVGGRVAMGDVERENLSVEGVDENDAENKEN